MFSGLKGAGLRRSAEERRLPTQSNEHPAPQARVQDGRRFNLYAPLRVPGYVR